MKKLNKKMKILLVSAITSLVSLTAQASGKTCAQGKVTALGSAILVAAAGMSDELNPVQDRRISVSDVLRNPRAAQVTDPAQVEAIGEMAKSSVRVFGAKMGDRALNNSTGAGGLYKGSSCYVLSAGHNITSLKPGTVNGKPGMVPDWDAEYFGARVKLEVGLGPGQTRRVVEGTVIKVGEGGTNGDFSVIRLDEPVTGGKMKTRVLAPEGLTGAKLMSIGIPGNKQTDKNQWNLFVDPSCKKIENRRNDNALMTDCLASPGNSGGFLAGETRLANGQLVWSFTGMVVKGDESSVGTGASSSGSEPGRSVNFKVIESAVDRVISADIRKTTNATCKEDASFLDQNL